MKSFLILFALAFAIASADFADDDFEKQEKAETECNALFPGYTDSRGKLITHVISGGKISFKNTTVWCHLNCVLQKIGFFDEQSNMRAPEVFKYNMKNLPELAGYADVFIMQLFQNYRSTKDMDDVCVKAYVAYYRFVESIFILTMSNNIQNDLNVKGAVIKAVEEGKPLPIDLKEKVKEYLKKTNTMLKFGVAELTGASSPASSIPVPVVPAAPSVPIPQAPLGSSPITNRRR